MKAGSHVRRWAPLLVGAAALVPIPVRAADGRVTIQNTAFHPPEVTVSVGETVVWTNQDDANHTVTGDGFDSNPSCPTLAGVFQDCLTKGETFEHEFNEPGPHHYRCKVHPSMTGVVTVEAAAAPTTVTTTPTTQAPTTVTTAATTTTRKLATSSTLASTSSTTSTTAPDESSTTASTNEAPAFDPDGEGDGDGGTAAPASSGGGGGSGTVALIVAALLAVAGGGGVLLWRLRPRASSSG